MYIIRSWTIDGDCRDLMRNSSLAIVDTWCLVDDLFGGCTNHISSKQCSNPLLIDDSLGDYTI